MKKDQTDPQAKSEIALREEAVLNFWREQNIFQKSVAKDAPNGDYVFYDGPPFATGLPHYGHILASTIKDAIPRFWTMNGYRVRRVWGWDCHGLPLENLIEKELGLATKSDIEEYGVKNFNAKARAAVLRYADDWAAVMPRMGRFVDMKNAYQTMDSTYTESVWWVFASLYKQGLVYEGFKSMHLCPRCGTTLSNFEVNQGYQDIKDIAVTVKLPLLAEDGAVTATSLLVWTTTPWTLPGNLAAAVHNEHTYVTVAVTTKAGRERLILAKERLAQLGEVPYKIVAEMKGADLVGRSYQPPFAYLANQPLAGKENAWRIYHADYVTLGEEGTGAVHLAPAYGEDDLALAKAHGVPVFHHVTKQGQFADFITDLAGQAVKPKDDKEAGVTHLDADILVTKALKANGTLFRKENVTHSYPHCWRCDTPLLNYATTSWFVAVSKLKDKLVAENKKINWVPASVGENRFGRWLLGARDWAVSRQRYWGAPLPVWRNPKTKAVHVFESLSQLQAHLPKSGNTYFTMRHGESEKNVISIVSNATNKHPLTERGRADVARAVAGQTFDLIFTSPVLRARQTAEVVATTLKMNAEQVVVDERLREFDYGALDGTDLAEFHKQFPRDLRRFTTRAPEGENWNDVRARVGEFLYELERTHQNKRVLIVSHGDPTALLYGVSAGLTSKAIADRWNQDGFYPPKGVLRELPFTPLPHNDHYELDFHRPYIDDIALYEGETKLERVPDVFDCWFESGSMPYGQHHYPFQMSEREFLRSAYPAQFIAEGLDQTRGWFYSLLVLGTALFGKSPYQNVIVNGLVLAEDGRKMSKKLKNYPDPMALADRHGVDATRYYLLSAPIMRGEDLNFSEAGVQEVQRKNLGRLHNVLNLYELYADDTSVSNDSDHVLDCWIIARLNQLIAESAAGYRSYELDRATRPLADFIDDLSVWYARLSRARLKGEAVADKRAALVTLRFVLVELAKVMAPAMPFYAEHLYRALRADNEPKSVHLADWPAGGAVDEPLLTDMRLTRATVRLALEARTKAGLKVRQPIARVTGPALPASQVPLILAELNAKAYQVGENVSIDTTLTPALKQEGVARDFIRAVQTLRKEAGLQPSDLVTLTVDTGEAGQAVIEAFRAEITRTVCASAIVFAPVTTNGTKLTAGTQQFTVAFAS